MRERAGKDRLLRASRERRQAEPKIYFQSISWAKDKLGEELLGSEVTR